MGRFTRGWLTVLGVLIAAVACDRSSPTSPSGTSNGAVGALVACRLQTYGVMTATLDGTPWVPVMTRATGRDAYITIEASDCTHWLRVELRGFHGPGTYDVADGQVSVSLECDGRFCGRWWATDVGRFERDIQGGGSVTVTSYTPRAEEWGTGQVEGTFEFTLVPVQVTGATGTRVISRGRFGSAFMGL